MFVLSDTEIKARVIGTMSDSVPVLFVVCIKFVDMMVHQRESKNMRVYNCKKK